MKKEELMRKAIELSIENVANGGGPFGAVIAKDGEIIATGANRVTSQCDPTAHAEVSAIRAAASKLGTFNLSGCEIYTSCEPCPMCLGAIYWARLDKMYYANNKTDAKNIGFDDSFIYDELSLKTFGTQAAFRSSFDGRGDKGIPTMDREKVTKWSINRKARTKSLSSAPEIFIRS